MERPRSWHRALALLQVSVLRSSRDRTSGKAGARDPPHTLGTDMETTAGAGLTIDR
jgi:hypothetical protein